MEEKGKTEKEEFEMVQSHEKTEMPEDNGSVGPKNVTSPQSDNPEETIPLASTSTSGLKQENSNGMVTVDVGIIDDPCTRCNQRCIANIESTQTCVHGLWEKIGPIVKKIFIILLIIGLYVYVVLALVYDATAARPVAVIATLVTLYFVYQLWWKRFGNGVKSKCLRPMKRCLQRRIARYFTWAIYAVIGLGILIFIIVDVAKDTKRLTSAFGMLSFIAILFITSTNPARVKWQPVLWGIGLQFFLGVLILRWQNGYHFFSFLGAQVEKFLDYTDEGSKLVFGEEGYLMHRMAFKVFPIVIYFSAVISIFYYWGLMQFIVCRIASVMQFTMGTTAIESLNAATNIFIGMAESCVVLKPFIHKLTKSELHAVMTGGFATVAGSYIALLVEVGAAPEHLLSAAIMSAPAALAMAKLNYPETEVSRTKTKKDVFMPKTPARNVVEAASNGAIDAIKVVASVAANLIAILGLIAFLNSTLSYMGARIGFPQLSFQLICYYVFWPVAVLMGVDLEDAGKVASLLGTKIFMDEFISFRDLGVMVEAGEIGQRSTIIATYACCGFGSIAALGVYIGALISIAPEKRGDISEVAFRAVINGNIAGFLTACIAGVLYTEDGMMFSHGRKAFLGNSTTNATLAALLNGTLTDIS